MNWRSRIVSPPSDACLKFCSEHLASFDLSDLNHVSIFRGKPYFGVYGFMECSSSRGRSPCHINTYIPGPFPYELTSLRTPLILKIESANIPSDAYVASRNVSIDRSEVRVSLRSRVLLNCQDEGFVWILGHEFFHYLTHTDQLDKPDTENNADEYGNFLLEQWRAI